MDGESGANPPPDRDWIEFEEPFPDSMLWALTGFLAMIVIAFIAALIVML